MTINDKPQCGICLEPIKSEMGKMDSCSHTFCFTCIFEWSKVTNLCPFCKKEFRNLTKQNLGSTEISPKRRKSGQVVKIKPKKQRIYDDENIDWDQFVEEEDYDEDDEDYLDNYDLNDTFIDDSFVPSDEEEDAIYYPSTFHRIEAVDKTPVILDSDDDDEEIINDKLEEEDDVIDLTQNKTKKRREILSTMLNEIHSKRQQSKQRSDSEIRSSFIDFDEEDDDEDYKEFQDESIKPKKSKKKKSKSPSKKAESRNEPTEQSRTTRRRLIKKSDIASDPPLIDLCTPDVKQTKITSFTRPISPISPPITTTTTTTSYEPEDIEEYDPISFQSPTSVDPIICTDSEDEIPQVVVSKKSPKRCPKVLCAESPDKPPVKPKTIIDDGQVILGTPKRKKVQEDHEYDSSDSTYISDNEYEALCEKWNRTIK